MCTIFSMYCPDIAPYLPYFRREAFAGFRVSSLLGKVMSGSISTLIHRCGPEWFEIYFRSRFHRSPPELTSSDSGRYFGSHMAQNLECELNPNEAQKLFYDLHRVALLGDTEGRNILQQTALQLQRKAAPPIELRSAFKQALFILWNTRSFLIKPSINASLVGTDTLGTIVIASNCQALFRHHSWNRMRHANLPFMIGFITICSPASQSGSIQS
jgi:hypothetical protein